MNNDLQITIDHKGAELVSIQCDGKEYLWNGDDKFWNRHAPILFPIVGKLADDKLRIEGHEYTMKQHGFARDTEFMEQDGWYVIARRNDEVIHTNYPYDFDLRVRYIVDGNTLTCNWQVKNCGDKNMYFQIGTHPAFLLPDFNANDVLHGFIRFYDKKGNTISPLVHHFLNGGLRCAYETPLALNNCEGLLALDDKTFENDALLIEGGQVASVALLDKYGREVLRVNCPLADAFGIWAPNKPGCPFVCIEPWCGIADNTGFKGDISERDCIHSLESGKSFNFSYSLTLNL